MIHSKVQKILLAHEPQLAEWFHEKASLLEYPIYSSYDVRDASYKLAAVDANIYPAGFNNICRTDKTKCPARFEKFFSSHYPGLGKRILLITERHTKNPYYWDNVSAIQANLVAIGRKVILAVPDRREDSLIVQNSAGEPLTIHSGFHDNPIVREFNPDFIISNNDFSDPSEEWAAQVHLPINPPRELGWYRRKKSLYFNIYNQLCHEFSEKMGLDPFLFTVDTEHFEHFDTSDESRRKDLASRIDAMLIRLQESYAKRGIAQKPFVFVKNNSGTYGLAVLRVGGGAEILNWSYNSRKKMKAAKGGADVEEVILQEGIPSIVKSEGSTAEPVVYMVGCEVAGGFLRTHQEKDETESLNSPGAVFKTFCFSNCEDPTLASSNPEVHAYGWIARLGLLAIAEEGKQMKVEFPGYRHHKCLA